MRRAGCATLHREHHTTRHNSSANEDGNTGAHRPTLGALRGYGGAAGRDRLPRILVHDRAKTPQAAAVLDDIHQQGGARHAASSHRRLPTLQRTDTVDRTALLPVYRDEADDLPRQGSAPAVPGAGGRGHERDVPERLLVVDADGGADRGTEEDSGVPRHTRLPTGLRHRVRLFRPYAAEAVVRVETRRRTVLRRSGERHYGI